ncbi:hypothetical protein [Evansella tamaricis]|uniref:Uncharacterized protein n=1 Tax=Evansella tamaricis TaxID=2069301 RepID=A0ABS6JFC1_9BACI|nr:hypothetical protein [Evansella tamaricis]MBU9712362.1 hypothetical protein [Evansella tamaricis]
MSQNIALVTGAGEQFQTEQDHFTYSLKQGITHYKLGTGEQEDDDTTLPIHWETISHLFKNYDQILLLGCLPTNDKMLQGNGGDLREMIIHLFSIGSIFYKKEVVMLQDGYNDRELNFLKEKRKLPHVRKTKGTVTSIQKIETRKQQSSIEWVNDYVAFLRSLTKGIIQVEQKDHLYFFKVMGLPSPLLTLERITDSASPNMVEISIRGGILNKERFHQKPLGRFWFVLTETHLFTALVHFKPSLPWIIYRLSQGWIHHMVMERFKMKLEKRQIE